MKKQSLFTALLVVLMSMTGAKSFAHNIEVANADGVTIYYVLTNNNTELAVSYRGSSRTYYSNEYSGSVVIPASVEYQGNTYSVTSINSSAFYYCNNLTSVTIPNSVKSIGSEAFYGCSGLTSVHITDLTAWCNISFSDNPLKYTHHLYMNGEEIKDLVIPNGVTSISQYAFSGCSKFTSVTIPNSVTSIGNSAFYTCVGLTSILIPNSVKSIGSYAFEECSHLTSVIIGSGVTSIDYGAFSGTNLKKTIWLTNTPPSGYSYAKGTVNYVSNDQFSSLGDVTKYQFLSSYFDVDGIRYVPISPSERTCDAIDCVYNESAKETKIASTVSYKGITMNVKNIKPYVAYSNPYIESLTVDNDGAISVYAFYGCNNMKSASVGEKVNSIGSYAFYNCSSLQSIIIPDAVLSLGDYAFSGCSAMTSVKIGNGVGNINQYAFSGCSTLKELTIGSKVVTIDKYAFSSCSSLPSITIPSAVATINNSVFYNCSNLTKIIIADSESTLSLGSNKKDNYDYGNPFFSSCPLDTVYIGRDISYNKESYYGYSPFYRNTSLRAVKITDKETEISDNEFYGCTNLQRVAIGDGVTSIGNWAFSGCQSLKFFAFGSQVATIGQEAFSDCTSVVEIISKAQAAPVCGNQALDDINKWDCMLYVPDGCMATYEAADQWKDFFFKEEGEGTMTNDNINPNNPEESKKCETPTITIANGVIHFACATEGVTYTYYVTASDPSGVGNDIAPSSLTLIVYASKPGYENSDAASIEIAASAGIFGDLTGDGVVNVADHVKLSSIIMDQSK